MTPASLSARRRSVLVAVAAVAAIVIPFLLFGDALEAWVTGLVSRRPGPGVAILCVALLAGDVLLPVPASIVSAACGAWWGVWAGAAISTLGMTLASVLGYALGRHAGSAGLARWIGPAEMRRLAAASERLGAWIVVVLRPVPVLAEASSIYAGFTAMPWTRFLAYSVPANGAVSLGLAAAGALARQALPPWGMPALLGGLTLLAAVLAAVTRRTGRGSRSTNAAPTTRPPR